MRKKVKNRRIKLNTFNQNDLSQIKESANESIISSLNSSYLNIDSDSNEDSLSDNSHDTRRSHKPDIFKSGTIDKSEFTLQNTDPDNQNDVDIEMELKYQ